MQGEKYLGICKKRSLQSHEKQAGRTTNQVMQAVKEVSRIQQVELVKDQLMERRGRIYLYRKKPHLNFRGEMKRLLNGLMQFGRQKKFVHHPNPGSPDPNAPAVSGQSAVIQNRREFAPMIMNLTRRTENWGVSEV